MKIRISLFIAFFGVLGFCPGAQAMSINSLLNSDNKNSSDTHISSPLQSPQPSPIKTTVQSGQVQSNSTAKRVLFPKSPDKVTGVKRTSSDAVATDQQKTDSVVVQDTKKPRYEVDVVYSQQAPVLSRVAHMIKSATPDQELHVASAWLSNSTCLNAIKKATDNGSPTKTYTSKVVRTEQKRYAQIVEKGGEVHSLGYNAHTKLTALFNNDGKSGKVAIGSSNLSSVGDSVHDNIMAFCELNGESPVKQVKDTVDQLKKYAIPCSKTGSPIKDAQPEKKWSETAYDNNRAVIDTTPQKHMIFSTIETKLQESFEKRINKPANADEKQRFKLATMNFADPKLCDAICKKCDELGLKTSTPRGSIELVVNAKLSKKSAEMLAKLYEKGAVIYTVDKGKLDCKNDKSIARLQHAKFIVRETDNASGNTEYFSAVSTGNFTEQLNREINHALFSVAPKEAESLSSIFKQIISQPGAKQFVPAPKDQTTTTTQTVAKPKKKAPSKKAVSQTTTDKTAQSVVVANTTVQTASKT